MSSNEIPLDAKACLSAAEPLAELTDVEKQIAERLLISVQMAMMDEAERRMLERHNQSQPITSMNEVTQQPWELPWRRVGQWGKSAARSWVRETAGASTGLKYAEVLNQLPPQIRSKAMMKSVLSGLKSLGFENQIVSVEKENRAGEARKSIKLIRINYPQATQQGHSSARDS